VRVSRLLLVTHRLAAQPPGPELDGAAIRRRDQRTPWAARPLTPRAGRLFNVTLTSSLRVHCSDFGVKSATQARGQGLGLGLGGLSMALEPTSTESPAHVLPWQLEHTMRGTTNCRCRRAARRSARDSTRRGAVGASAAAAGRVRRARTAAEMQRNARCAVRHWHCGSAGGRARRPVEPLCFAPGCAACQLVEHCTQRCIKVLRTWGFFSASTGDV
jgi:hypothetical protein